MNDYLNKHPFDLYDLNLFQLVADTGSFTQAAQTAGLTQSAVTRQIKDLEDQLGVPLFERTTRKVHLTAAGKLLHIRAREILHRTESAFQELQQTFQLAPPRLHIGVARSIGFSYYPGYFMLFQHEFPNVQLHVYQKTSAEIIAALEDRTLDAGLLCPPRRLPRDLEITHSFKDEFTLIASDLVPVKAKHDRLTVAEARKQIEGKRWLTITSTGNTGQQLAAWFAQHRWNVQPAMELDSFDTIVNLVNSGMGISYVPHRSLPLYRRSRSLQCVFIDPPFKRDLVVVTRKAKPRPEPLNAFINHVLFGRYKPAWKKPAP